MAARGVGRTLFQVQVGDHEGAALGPVERPLAAGGEPGTVDVESMPEKTEPSTENPEA